MDSKSSSNAIMPSTQLSVYINRCSWPEVSDQHHHVVDVEGHGSRSSDSTAHGESRASSA
jgi:hypothetical protein